MQLMMAGTPGISAFPRDGNLLAWTATIKGPDDTPYQGLTFKLSLDFPSNYPMTPPTVLFTTPMFHPNVDMAGRICLDILKVRLRLRCMHNTILRLIVFNRTSGLRSTTSRASCCPYSRCWASPISMAACFLLSADLLLTSL